MRRSACATCSPNGRRLRIAAPASSRAPSERCCFSSARARSSRWCCHDGTPLAPPPGRALDRRAGAPAFRPGARHLPAGAFPDARSRHSRRSPAGKLLALERSAAGQARRKRSRLSSPGAHAGRAAAAGDRESSLARWTERARHDRGRTVGRHRAHPAGAPVLKNHMTLERLKTDILILGSGGAGLFAALHAHKANPDLDVTVATKGLLGKCGCTRMVQGGYNVALNPGDSVERHFMDTIEGGKWLPHQELAWTLVSTAVERVRELENEIGCFFDRNPDGTLHEGDLTGIEIINRLMEQVWARPIRRLEEHRAVALVPAHDGALAGVLMIDIRTGAFRFVAAQAVLLATGGGPTMYRYHTPSGDKSMDGLAMALRAGLPLRDMEM